MMPSCEKCWADSRMTHNDDGIAYTRLLHERQERGETCTPEEQAGPDAGECPKCHRMTMHQHCRDVCMAGCK